MNFYMIFACDSAVASKSAGTVGRDAEQHFTAARHQSDLGVSDRRAGRIQHDAADAVPSGLQLRIGLVRFCASSGVTGRSIRLRSDRLDSPGEEKRREPKQNQARANNRLAAPLTSRQISPRGETNVTGTT